MEITKEKLKELISSLSLQREDHKEKFHKIDGMIIAYEKLIKDLETDGTGSNI